MAAGLDVAAGALGITGIALQLSSSIFKIKKFCAEVQNAPDELQTIVQEIENLSNILASFTKDEPELASSETLDDAFQASLGLCSKAVSRLSAVVSQLHGPTERIRIRNKVKIVLKRERIQSILEKLDRSKADLHLAYSIYENAQRRREFDSIRKYMDEERSNRIQMVEYIRTISQEQTAEHYADDDNLTREIRRRKIGTPFKHGSRIEICIQLPRWLCQYAWDVAVERACGRLTMTLKSYKILSD